MEEKGTATDVRQLLRVAAVLWGGYVFTPAGIDHLLYPRPLFAPRYYVVNSLNALTVLGLPTLIVGAGWGDCFCRSLSR